MAKIKQIKAREILDSRGNPTIEATVVLHDDSVGIASCPSGTSIGGYEAMELRDRDDKRYEGKGVLKAIEAIENTISPSLLGKDANNQAGIDKIMIELDGTQNKGILGANAILSVSMAVSKAAARSSVLPVFLYLRQFIKKGLPLRVPTPLFNLINGGSHASNNVDFQEFLVIPATSKSYGQALELGVSLWNSLKKILLQNNLSTLIGDEGGFGPHFSSNLDAFPLLKQAVDKENLKFAYDIFLGLDAAANNIYREQRYKIRDKAMSLTSSELITYYEDLNKQYSLLYLEDPLAEDDWDGWGELVGKMSGKTLIVGDDLIATNPYRLQMAIGKKAITGVVIKPNQIGTVIESLAVVEVARQAGLKIIVSHRSGETNDDFIADFSVAVSSDYVKFGAPSRGERVSKYNRLLQIEKQLSSLGK